MQSNSSSFNSFSVIFVTISISFYFILIINSFIFQNLPSFLRWRFKVVSKRHLKKLDKFWKIKGLMRNETKYSVYIKHTVYNFSSYAFSDECKALSYGLDHHIPTPCNYNPVETEFELFYQNILPIFCTFLKTNWRSWKVNFEIYAISTTR